VLSDSDQARYQLAYGPRPKDLIVRLDTNDTIQVDIPELVELRERICKAYGLRAEGHRLQIFAVAAD
jgi:Fe2+ or Zn2+ uptake regulation protein